MRKVDSDNIEEEKKSVAVFKKTIKNRSFFQYQYEYEFEYFNSRKINMHEMIDYQSISSYISLVVTNHYNMIKKEP